MTFSRERPLFVDDAWSKGIPEAVRTSYGDEPTARAAVVLSFPSHIVVEGAISLAGELKQDGAV